MCVCVCVCMCMCVNAWPEHSPSWWVVQCGEVRVDILPEAHWRWSAALVSCETHTHTHTHTQLARQMVSTLCSRLIRYGSFALKQKTSPQTDVYKHTHTNTLRAEGQCSTLWENILKRAWSPETKVKDYRIEKTQ